MTTVQPDRAFSATPDEMPAAHLPGLEVVRPGARTTVSAAVARRLFTAAIGRLPVTVRLGDGPDARVVGRGGPEMTVHRPEEFFARVGRDGLIGFGEAYLTGAWDATDLAGFLTVPAARIHDLVPQPLQRLRRLVVHRTPAEQRSTQENSRANISHHYDLSNDLFALFLDATWSYSSALFDTSLSHSEPGLLVAAPPGPDSTEDLAGAQARKIERLLDEAGVGEGSRVLEIGTGWGELAIRAARRGATVRSITLSSEQQELARHRIAEAGYADRVEVDLCDYRDLTTDPVHHAAYDSVLSVEMIEAVGHEFWGTYFEMIDTVLAPGGRVGIQAITMPHDRMLATRDTHTWITKYIFPGGFLPSVEAIDEVTRERTGLRLTGRLSFGSHYAATLHRWDEAFLGATEQLEELGFDEAFRRIWHFYLAYTQAGFAAGYIDVQQLTFTREG
jgi:cyclopropane-fatty-acyl-phospholipid synthase